MTTFEGFKITARVTLEHIFYSIFFMHLKKFGSDWDKQLSELLDFYEKNLDLVETSTYLIILGDIKVWVGNKYYAYGTQYNRRLEEFRPRLRTMIRLAKMERNLYHSDINYKFLL